MSEQVEYAIAFYRLVPKRDQAMSPLYEEVVVQTFSNLDDERFRTVSFIVKMLKKSGAKDITIEKRTRETSKSYRKVSIAEAHERGRKEIEDWKSIAK